MRKTPLPSGISPDTMAVISAAEELTLQVRRIADALTPPVAVIRDGVLTPLNTATPTPTKGPRCVCGDPIEWLTGPDGSAGWIHSPGSDTPILDAHTPRPPAPSRATDGATCRHMETRTCPASYAGPCGERPCARFESDDPLPWLATAADEASYYRQLSAEQGQALSRAEASRAEAQRDRDQHAAVLRQVRQVIADMEGITGARTWADWLRKAVEGVPERRLTCTSQETPAADEDAARTARRDSLRHLAGGGERIALSLDETALLRRHIDAEIREHDTARAVAAEEERLRFALAAERDRWKERSRGAGHERDIIAADLDTAVRLRAEAQRDRDQHAAVLREVLDRFRAADGGHLEAYATRETLDQWRSTVAPPVERPWWEQAAAYEQAAVEATKHVLELKAVIERARHLVTGAAQTTSAGLSDHDIGRFDMAVAILAALDGTEQPSEHDDEANTEELREQLHAAIKREIYEYRERTALWGETEGVTEEITRLAIQAALTVLGTPANEADIRKDQTT
jgi:hypothetical protein